MKKLLLGSFLVLASLNSFAATGELGEVNCSVPALKRGHEEVKSELKDMMIELKVETMRVLGSLLLQFDSNDIVINKSEKTFFNNYSTEISGTATMKDGTAILIVGEIQYGQATFNKKHDRLGNYLGKFCGFTAFANVNLINSKTGRVIKSLSVPSVKLELLKR